MGHLRPLERGDQAPLIGWASMYRTAGRPDAPWRYNGAFSPDSLQTPGRQGQLPADLLPRIRSRPTAPRWRSWIAPSAPALTDKMVEIVANSWTVMPIIEGMGYYAINTKRSASSRRSPDATSSEMCSSASRGPNRIRGRSDARRRRSAATVGRRYEALHRPTADWARSCSSWWR